MTLPHGVMPLHLSAWQEGADAAKAGKASTDCPYDPGDYNFVTWHNGWCFKMHLMARNLAFKTQPTPFENDEDF